MIGDLHETAWRTASPIFTPSGGGYDRKDEFEKMHIVRTADGKVSAHAVITHRTYLTDTRFIVLLEGATSLLEQCAAALENPKWGVWFGRKWCIPASPLLPSLAPSQEEALKKISNLLGLDQSVVPVGEGRCEAALDGVWYPARQARFLRLQGVSHPSGKSTFFSRSMKILLDSRAIRSNV